MSQFFFPKFAFWLGELFSTNCDVLTQYSHRTLSTWVQNMAFCLVTPRHYLPKYWHSVPQKTHFDETIKNTKPFIQENAFENAVRKILLSDVNRSDQRRTVSASIC